jgi:hypothetical protein
MASIEVDVVVKGVPAALHLLNSVPGGLVGPAAEGAIGDLLEEGISLMSTHIQQMTLTDKKTGVLAESIQADREGDINQSGDGAAGRVTIVIGSALPYSEYVAREIGWSRIEENVLIEPMGRWVFIDVRPPIPAHPFLEYTLRDLLDTTMPKALGQRFIAQSILIQTEVDALQRSEGIGT